MSKSKRAHVAKSSNPVAEMPDVRLDQAVEALKIVQQLGWDNARGLASDHAILANCSKQQASDGVTRWERAMRAVGIPDAGKPITSTSTILEIYAHALELGTSDPITGLLETIGRRLSLVSSALTPRNQKIVADEDLHLEVLEVECQLNAVRELYGRMVEQFAKVEHLGAVSS